MPTPEPALFARRVLLAVIGLTPQVLTETLWCLVRRAPPFVPTALRVLTTSEGATRLWLTLGAEGAARLQALADDLRRPELADLLTRDAVDVATDPSGRPLDDIRTPDDHLAIADRLTRTVREITADPDTALHVSIAGGRKTMGFLAGYVLSLFARPQDRLSHVLVDRAFEWHPQFFFPPARPEVLIVPPDGRPVRTDAAGVTLAEIPFVRLRDGLPDELLSSGASYVDAVAAAQAGVDEPELVLDIAGRVARAAGRELRLPPLQLAFLLAMARRRITGCAGTSWRELAPAEILDAYDTLFGMAGPRRERLAAALAAGIDRAWFEERKARHDKLVNQALGRRAGPYRLQRVGRRPVSRYQLALPAERIAIVGVPG